MIGMRRQEANDDDRMSETDEVRQDIDDVRCKVQSRSVRVCVVSELMNRQVELERARKRQSASQPASAVTAAWPKGKAARALSTFVLFFWPLQGGPSLTHALESSTSG